MTYSDNQILNAIAVAKCCMGDYTCRMLAKAMKGSEYNALYMTNIKLSLIIFAMSTNVITGNKCLTDQEVEKMVHKINKLCQCNCISDSTESTVAGQHTVSTHTVISHTE